MLSRMQIIQLTVDVLLLIIGMVPFILLFVLGHPFKRGFFCDDQTLMYPYHPSSVSTSLMLTSWSLGGFALYFTVEFLLYGRPLRDHWLDSLWRSLKVCSAYAVGLIVTAALSELPKNAVGRLRPHFFHVCAPDFSKINCSDGYITDFTCLNTQGYPEGLVEDAGKSFPSGHASVSVFCAIFVGVYIEQRLDRLSWSVLLRIMVQTACAAYAMIICISRINDYKHHWSDVVGGAIIGCLCATWMVLSLGKHIGLYGEYKWHTQEQEKEEPPSSPDVITIRAPKPLPFRFAPEPEVRVRTGSTANSQTEV